MLTDNLIQSILPADRIIKKADGLNICVLPNGRREWRLSYRFDHKQKSITGGAYPLMSIDRARVWREEMKAALSTGHDPAQIKRQQRHEDRSARTTCRQLAQQWMIAKRPGWSDRYAGVIERRLEADIFSTIGKLSVRSILPRDMLNALKAIEDRGAMEMAHRVRAYCSEIFRFGIPDGRVKSDPCRDLGTVMRKRAAVSHRSKVPIKELPRFYAALNADTGPRLSHESGLFNADWIELQLAHVPGGVRAVYNAARYLPHRRKMLEWWADYLDKAEQAPGNRPGTYLLRCWKCAQMDIAID